MSLVSNKLKLLQSTVRVYASYRYVLAYVHTHDIMFVTMQNHNTIIHTVLCIDRGTMKILGLVTLVTSSLYSAIELSIHDMQEYDSKL